MNIFVDENVPLMTVIELREKGFNVIDIRDTINESEKDADISCM